MNERKLFVVNLDLGSIERFSWKIFSKNKQPLVS